MLRFIKNLIIFIVVSSFIIFLLSRGEIYPKDKLKYGVTFSPDQATFLGLDWKKTYLRIFDELGARKIRLSAYWDEIESEKDGYNWKDIDWQINEASDRNAEIILAIGTRLPRWPECHTPGWATSLDREKFKTELLDYIEKTINRYKNNQQITAWQIENEPFLSHYFGECPDVDTDLLDAEIALAKKLDNRPIVVTDSGELSLWVFAAKRADIFGTTMYRDTYSRQLKRYVHYPITPGFFRFKKNLARLFAHPQKWIVIEMQAEPWGRTSYNTLSKSERELTMDLQKFQDMLEFGRQAGFEEFYLWGVEYWYWLEETQNDSSFLNEAQKLF